MWRAVRPFTHSTDVRLSPYCVPSTAPGAGGQQGTGGASWLHTSSYSRRPVTQNSSNPPETVPVVHGVSHAHGCRLTGSPLYSDGKGHTHRGANGQVGASLSSAPNRRAARKSVLPPGPPESHWRDMQRSHGCREGHGDPAGAQGDGQRAVGMQLSGRTWVANPSVTGTWPGSFLVAGTVLCIVQCLAAPLALGLHRLDSGSIFL